jgi:hypothetical protein
VTTEVAATSVTTPNAVALAKEGIARKRFIVIIAVHRVDRGLEWCREDTELERKERAEQAGRAVSGYSEPVGHEPGRLVPACASAVSAILAGPGAPLPTASPSPLMLSMASLFVPS